MNWDIVQPNLEKRGFATRRFATAADARAALIEEIGENKKIGLGGSMSVVSLDIEGKLKEKGCIFYNHSACAPENIRQELINAQFSDYYLASSSAVSQDGVLYNIDGRGNRVTAMLWGSSKLILVIGKNKIVPKGEGGFERIRREACPPNCRRLNRSTGCALTGKCTDCAPSAGRICNAFVTIEHPAGRPTELWLVDEDMGY